jgi:hypothetical protein
MVWFFPKEVVAFHRPQRKDEKKKKGGAKNVEPCVALRLAV